MRAYDFLQQEGVIYNRRGIGNHVSSDAGEKILAARREKFLQSDLPVLFRNLSFLDIGFDELDRLYTDFMNENRKNNK
jgi:GntR family transcriptional regulator